VGHVARMQEMKNAYVTLVGKPERPDYLDVKGVGTGII
jgi:hypothetical protein